MSVYDAAQFFSPQFRDLFNKLERSLLIVAMLMLRGLALLSSCDLETSRTPHLLDRNDGSCGDDPALQKR
jgi:hypothetical protein